MALPDETALRLLAKRKIEIAALPRQVPESAFAGKGSGLPCSLCEQRISAQEYELEYARAMAKSHGFIFAARRSGSTSCLNGATRTATTGGRGLVRVRRAEGLSNRRAGCGARAGGFEPGRQLDYR